MWSDNVLMRSIFLSSYPVSLWSYVYFINTSSVCQVLLAPSASNVVYIFSIWASGLSMSYNYVLADQLHCCFMQLYTWWWWWWLDEVRTTDGVFYGETWRRSPSKIPKKISANKLKFKRYVQGTDMGELWIFKGRWVVLHFGNSDYTTENILLCRLDVGEGSIA